MRVGNLDVGYVNFTDSEPLIYQTEVSQELADTEEAKKAGLKQREEILWSHRISMYTVLGTTENADNPAQAVEASALCQKIHSAKEDWVDLDSADVQLIRQMALQMEKFPTFCRAPLEQELKLAESIPAGDTSANDE